IERLGEHSQIRVLGAMTHFACADDMDLGHAQRQLACFKEFREQAGPQFLYAAANSAALVAMPASHFDWVRPGIMLYGSSPFAHRTAKEFGLRPVMTLESGLMSVRELSAGDTVGYGAAWQASGAARMGV